MGSACLLLLLFLTSSMAQQQLGDVAGAKADKQKDKRPEVQSTQVYGNGSFHGSWRDNSMGCQRCNFEDVAKRRNGSAASLSAVVAAWGSLVFASSQVEYADSILDFWVKGSGLTAISLYIRDSATKTLSQDVRFHSPDQLQAGITILGNDDDGFIHIQVALSALRAGTNSSDPASASCGGGFQKNQVLPFDAIVFADISGMGFTLVLDDVKLVSKDAIAASAAPWLESSNNVRPPVFGDDLTNLKAGRNRYTMRLKPSTGHANVTAICNELGGLVAGPRRFSGICNTRLSTLGNGDRLSWRLVTLTVRTRQDLDAMRTALPDDVAYFEADLTGFTSIRGMRQAATQEKKLDIPFQSPSPVPVQDPIQAAGRPCWADEGCLGGEWFKHNRAEEVEADRPRASGGANAAETSGSIQSVSSWGLDRINQVDLPLDSYYRSGDYDGRGVHVYVLDTGLRTTHLDFRGRVGDGASAVGTSFEDDNGHGTHVSGTVLGSVHGVAPSAILHPVKVMDANGNGAYSNMIAGLQWVKDHKQRNNIASAVISMSVAGPRSAALNDAIEAASAAGITVVTAAGNNKGGDACTMSPASATSSITVGASTDTDAMASMSNIGSCLSMFAPGAYIASASWKGDSEESWMSGTSMATPHVAGAAALYLQMRPGAPPAEVKAALTAAAVSRYFEASSPQRLLNVISSRLRAAQQKVAPAAKPSPSPSPKPSSSPSPKPVVVTPKPSPSPSPKPPTQKPSPSPSPKPATPQPTPNPFWNFPINTKPAICSTCRTAAGADSSTARKGWVTAALVGGLGATEPTAPLGRLPPYSD